MSDNDIGSGDVQVATDLSHVELSDTERGGIAELEQGVIRAKLALADLDIQAVRMDAARAELRQKVVDATQAYVERVVAVAGDHGIDVKDNSTKWNFDTSKMSFSRQS